MYCTIYLVILLPLMKLESNREFLSYILISYICIYHFIYTELYHEQKLHFYLFIESYSKYCKSSKSLYKFIIFFLFPCDELLEM